jgi:transposase-like protein
MGRKPRVDRSPEEKWQIVQEGLKSGNVPETCRRHGIAPNLVEFLGEHGVESRLPV